MVAVRVGDDHAFEHTSLGSKQLLAQIRAAIDQHALAGALDQDRGAKVMVSRLVGIALTPLIADLRHPG